MSYRKLLTMIAIVLFLVSLVMTSIGGGMDVLSSRTITKRHAWNDGLYMAVAAVFVLLLARA